MKEFLFISLEFLEPKTSFKDVEHFKQIFYLEPAVLNIYRDWLSPE